MVTSPNLGLKIWNLTTDAYNSAQLADNWARVDQHTHAFGMGAQIPTGGIADGAITTPKLDPGITTTPTDGSVSTVKLADGAVTTAKLGNSSVTAPKILSLGTPVVTALPSAPVDGQICAYNADPTNGVIWMFRYRSASGSSYKWEFIGGSELLARVDGDVVIGTSGWHTSTLPTVTYPLDGDYRLEWGGQIPGLTVHSLGVTPTVDGNPAAADRVLCEGAGMSTKRGVAVAAGTVARLSVLDATTVTNSWILIRPVRVG